MTAKKQKKAPKKPEGNSQEETGAQAKEATAAVFKMGVTLSGYGRINAGSPVTKNDREAFKSRSLDIDTFI